MKSAILYFSILILIVALGFWSDNYLQRKTNKLTGMLDTIQQQVEEKSEPDYAQLHTEWNKSKHMLEALVDHKDVRNIDESIADLPVYLGDETMATESLATISRLRALFDALPHQMRFRLENIF